MTNPPPPAPTLAERAEARATKRDEHAVWLGDCGDADEAKADAALLRELVAENRRLHEIDTFLSNLKGGA